MSECRADAVRVCRRWRWAALGLVACALGGCATGGVRSSVFVDPSRYDLYDCPQLATVRKDTNARVIELEGLIAKAETGFAGGVVSALAYRSEYEAALAQRDLADQKIVSNNCAAENPPAAVMRPVVPAAKKKKNR